VIDLADLADLDVTVDGLTRDYRLVQRRRGHRHSTDDLLTGWYAAEHVAKRERLLDLGSGIGSVGLLVLWRSKGAHLTAIEAQAESFRLLEKNIAINDLGDRVRAIHGDLREVRFSHPGDGSASRSVDIERFDLVTGSPPYFDVKDGIISPDPQRAHARFELRGDVRDYCLAARAALAEDGRFVFCFPTNQRERAERAIANAELAIERSRDVVPRRGIAPLFSLWVCRRMEDDGPATVREPDYVVRDEQGVQTEMHAAARASFGMG
jgi:tRNA1Val (adenine37-N6)-methyltransferase